MADSEQQRRGDAISPLVRARFAHGWTQGDLASRAGLTSKHLCRIELGYAKPTIPTAERLAEVLGVEIGALFPAGLARQHRLPRSGVRVPSLAGT